MRKILREVNEHKTLLPVGIEFSRVVLFTISTTRTDPSVVSLTPWHTCKVVKFSERIYSPASRSDNRLSATLLTSTLSMRSFNVVVSLQPSVHVHIPSDCK